MYIGQPKIMLRDRSGNPTVAGQVWLDMGGRDPVRFQGNIQSTPNTKYVTEGGRRHVLQKLAKGDDGPEWQRKPRGGSASGSRISGRL